jgi:hypothetical protein
MNELTFQQTSGYVALERAITEIAERLFGAVPALLDYRTAAE